jgi:hypothetical protein
VLALEVFSAAGDGEFAVFNPFGGDEFVRDLLDGGGFAADRQDLHAVVMIEVHVQRGDDHVVVVVLNIGERSLDMLLVMVVNQGDGAGDFVVGEALVMLNETGTDKIRNGLRAVGVALLLRHLVQLPSQRPGHRNREPHHSVVLRFFHCKNVNRRAEEVNGVEGSSEEKSA